VGRRRPDGDLVDVGADAREGTRRDDLFADGAREDDPLEPDEEMFTQAVNERKDPAMDDDPGDDYSF